MSLSLWVIDPAGPEAHKASSPVPGTACRPGAGARFAGASPGARRQGEVPPAAAVLDMEGTGDGLLKCSPAGAICAMGGGEGERMGRWPPQGEPAGEGDVGRSTAGSKLRKPGSGVRETGVLGKLKEIAMAGTSGSTGISRRGGLSARS